MALEDVDGLAGAGVPDYCVLIEGAGEDLVAVGVEI